MTTMKRKDQWTANDDKILVDTVLEIVTKGGTQIHAFDIVAKKLGRTRQACGFRWNKTLRHTFGHALKQAKLKHQHPVHTHLKQAMTSYDELLGAHKDLQEDHALLVDKFEHLRKLFDQVYTTFQSKK